MPIYEILQTAAFYIPYPPTPIPVLPIALTGVTAGPAGPYALPQTARPVLFLVLFLAHVPHSNYLSLIHI